MKEIPLARSTRYLDFNAIMGKLAEDTPNADSPERHLYFAGDVGREIGTSVISAIIRPVR